MPTLPWLITDLQTAPAWPITSCKFANNHSRTHPLNSFWRNNNLIEGALANYGCFYSYDLLCMGFAIYRSACTHTKNNSVLNKESVKE